MKLMKNPELRYQIAVYIFITLLFTIVSFLQNTICGIIMLSACVIFTSFHFFTTYKRYKKIAELSLTIDLILHGNNELFISECNEGELAILCSEIHKMTVRLKEQTKQLQNDKLYLVDSIANISHQLRTPLTSINLTVSMLSADNLSKEKRMQLTRSLKKSLERIDWLITTLLKISKLDAGTVHFKHESVAVKDLIIQIINPSYSTYRT